MYIHRTSTLFLGSSVIIVCTLCLDNHGNCKKSPHSPYPALHSSRIPSPLVNQPIHIWHTHNPILKYNDKQRIVNGFPRMVVALHSYPCLPHLYSFTNRRCLHQNETLALEKWRTIGLRGFLIWLNRMALFWLAAAWSNYYPERIKSTCTNCYFSQQIRISFYRYFHNSFK